MDCKPLLSGVKAGTFGQRPTLQNTVQLQAQVVMKLAGGVFLDYVKVSFLTRLNFALRLRRACEAAFLTISVK